MSCNTSTLSAERQEVYVNDFHSIKEERRTKGARCSKRSHESIKATATYSGRCRKVAFGVDKREATSRRYCDREPESTDSSDSVSDNKSSYPIINKFDYFMYIKCK
jgi:hypothetical protein